MLKSNLLSQFSGTYSVTSFKRFNAKFFTELLNNNASYSTSYFLCTVLKEVLNFINKNEGTGNGLKDNKQNI